MYTLVDITDTNKTDPKNFTLKYKQAQNLSCVLQTLGLRSQIVYYQVKNLKKQDMAKFNFGSGVQGEHRIWKLEFASEHRDTWQLNDDLLFHAKKDLNYLPVYTDLKETTTIHRNAIVTTGSDIINTYFTF